MRPTSKISPKKITLTMIGCGNMGGAMMRGWIGSNILSHGYIYTRSGIDTDIDNHAHVTSYTAMHSLEESLHKSDLLILAVKPQGMAEILTNIKDILPRTLTVISVAAGLRVEFFTKKLNASQPFIRIMPNTPCSIGCGMSGIYATNNVTINAKTMAETLMCAVGETLWQQTCVRNSSSREVVF